jgi:hypothetical protein
VDSPVLGLGTSSVEIVKRKSNYVPFSPSKDEAQTALFKAPVRTAL